MKREDEEVKPLFFEYNSINLDEKLIIDLKKKF